MAERNSFTAEALHMTHKKGVLLKLYRFSYIRNMFLTPYPTPIIHTQEAGLGEKSLLFRGSWTKLVLE